MNADSTSHRRVLRATSIIGGATLGALIVGLLRNKAVAVIGGAEAVGLFGLLTSIMGTAGALAALGLDSSVTRLLSRSADDPAGGAIRWIAWIIAWPLALIGAAATWIFRDSLAVAIVGDAGARSAVGLLSVGVAATVLGALQLSIIQAYGRIGDAARVRLIGSIAATVVGVAAIWKLGITGISIAVVAVPVATVVVVSLFALRLPSKGPPNLHVPDALATAASMFSIGALVTLTQAVANLSALAGRAIVTQDLSLRSAGFYHASNAIVSVNLTLLLNAVVADFYPRASKVIHDPEALSRALNEQVHVMLVLAAPVLMILSVCAPLVLNLLFSSEFAGSADLLRLFVVANVLRLPSWGLSFVLLARGAGMSFLIGEVAGLLFVPAMLLLIPAMGLNGAGFAALIGTVATFACYVVLAGRGGVRLTRLNVIFSIVVIALMLATAGAFRVNQMAGVAVGLACTLGLSWMSAAELRRMIGNRGTVRG